MAVEKPHLNLAVIGHIDHGKSTMVGRLMFETGAVPRTLLRATAKRLRARVRQPLSLPG